MAAAASGLFDPGDVLTHAYPLEQLDRALNDTRDRPGNFVKALVRP
jgi:threonine dehydrogenase-like Zn-dependent dehydrogenase